MAAFDNLGFETAGAGAGEAQSWTQAVTSTAFEIAAFDSGALPVEAFETGWGADPYIEEFDLDVDVEPPVFDSAGTPQAFEDFENLWTDTVNLA